MDPHVSDSTDLSLSLSEALLHDNVIGILQSYICTSETIQV